MSVQQIFQEQCRTGRHPFEKILEGSRSFCGEAAVVNWCPICGTVSLDLEVDGRVHPGYFKPARRAQILERQ